MTVQGSEGVRLWKKCTDQVAFLAEWVAFHGVEGLSTELLVALEAGKALNVVDHFHSSAAAPLAHHLLAAFIAHACRGKEE